MILLLHESIPGPVGRPLNHARTVVYSRLDEVPTLLLADPNVLRTPVHQLRSRVEGETSVQPVGDHDGQGQRINMPQERIAEENEVEEGDGSGGDREQEIDERMVKAAKPIQNAYRRHLERKQAVRDSAAKKIQAAYLRHLKRKSIVRKGIDATQARYWHLLRKRSMEMEWTKGSRYYLLFRVPLAYILVCLDVVGEFVESKKNESKKRMKNEDDRNLETLMDALHRQRSEDINFALCIWPNRSPSKLLKQTIVLQKKLAPSSEFHEERSVSNLQRAVLEVKAVVEGLDDIPGSIGTKNQIEKRLNRGYRWVFEKQGTRAKGRKAEKPKLVLDREDLLYF